MGSNSFGSLFKITTFGESHGESIGVVIDGCPSGLEICEKEIQQALERRKPGRMLTSPRKESDEAHILSGVFEGKTTGAPIGIVIPNRDRDSSKYEPIKKLLRPGHANFTYLEKYGVFDYRGGGRASARETACRVAAGAVAQKFLLYHQIEVIAYIKEMGGIEASLPDSLAELKEMSYTSPLFCPDPKASEKMIEQLQTAQKEGDSIGAIIEMITSPLPRGLGEPIYEKLEAKLAHAMLSIPACKAFEMGDGFALCRKKGSESNDCFQQGATLITNHSGGVLGGISSGMPLKLRVGFKPTSSIAKPQQTVDLQGEEKELRLPEGSRHDPCVGIRAVPVVIAMGALVLADLLLMNRASRL